MKKKTISYQEKYRNGVFITLEELNIILQKNKDNLQVELQSRVMYTDDTESISIKLTTKYK